MLKNMLSLAAIVLMLAVAFRLTVPHPASAQARGTIAGFSFTTDGNGIRRPAVILSNGDIYIEAFDRDQGITAPVLYGNIWLKYDRNGKAVK